MSEEQQAAAPAANASEAEAPSLLDQLIESAHIKPGDESYSIAGSVRISVCEAD